MATGDYTDRAAVNQHIGLPDTDARHYDLLDVLIPAVSRAIDGYCRRQFYATTETRYFDYADGYQLWLDKDLISVTTLTNGDGDVLVDGTDFVKWPYSGPPYRRLDILTNGGNVFTYSGTAQRAISIAGSWGYASTTPSPVARACILWCADLLGRQGFEAVADTQIADERVKFVAVPSDAPPPLAAMLLQPFIRRDYA